MPLHHERVPLCPGEDRGAVLSVAVQLIDTGRTDHDVVVDPPAVAQAAIMAAGIDLLNGASDNDVLNGGDDADRLLGTAGNDLVNGEAGDDVAFGGSGNLPCPMI
jgi:Ca2+-binding RTX toxin-like protein